MHQEKQLVLSQQLVASTAADGAVMHATIGQPLQINEEAWKLLALFRSPRTSRAAAVAGGISRADQPLFAQLVERFWRVGFLVEPNEDRYLYEKGSELASAAIPALAKPDTPLLGAQSTPRKARIQIVGVPFEHPLTPRGAAHAPAVLRTLSASLPCYHDPQKGRCRGFRHIATGQVLLDGARLCDHGDIHFLSWEGIEDAYCRIATVVRQVKDQAAGTLVVIGGDHAVTEPVVRALDQAPLFVVHFDAHTDLYPLFRSAPHNHGNVMERLRRYEHVQGLLQLGVRDWLPPWWLPPPKVKQVGAQQAAQLSEAELLALIPPRARCYLSLDIDVLDAAYAPGTGTAVPGGLSLAQLTRLLLAIGSRRHVVAMDLVEVAPHQPGGGVTALTALDILAQFLHALDRRLRQQRV